MTYEQIIKKITKGLTGNTSKDIKYLQEQMEYYKDHSMSQEILRACGRIMYDLFPEDKKSEILAEINDIQPKIKELSRLDNYCKEIKKRSESIQYNLNNFDKDLQKI